MCVDIHCYSEYRSDRRQRQRPAVWCHAAGEPHRHGGAGSGLRGTGQGRSDLTALGSTHAHIRDILQKSQSPIWIMVQSVLIKLSPSCYCKWIEGTKSLLLLFCCFFPSFVDTLETIMLPCVSLPDFKLCTATICLTLVRWICMSKQNAKGDGHERLRKNKSVKKTWHKCKKCPVVFLSPNFTRLHLSHIHKSTCFHQVDFPSF